MTLILPWPPSANRLWRSYRGKVVRSTEYRNWQDVAGKEIMRQRPTKHTGQVEVDIELGAPNKRPYDVDNKIKACLDVLVSMRIIESDDHKIVKKVSVCQGAGFVGARVSVVAA